MLSFLQYLDESTRDAQEDESEIVHHLSPFKFKKFKPLSHFGTRQAAREIIKTRDEYFDEEGEPYDLDPSKIYHYAAKIKLGNIAEIEDDGEDHNPQTISYALHRAGHITDSQRNEHEKLGDELTNQHVVKALRENDIQTVSYKNAREDKGSTSYMITHPSQVRVIRQTGKYSKLNLDKE